MKTLYEKLKEYGESDYYPFHMPGHKRNGKMTGAALPYEIDITEIEGFDDLHHARGILQEAQERAAMVYQAGETHFLVNGSTCGILSAILGCTQRGDMILIARNCHKSVYHAIFLNELQPVYVYPQFHEELELNGEIGVPEVVRALQEYPDIRAVVVTSPTYDGVVSDVSAIAEAAHKKGIPLIVDEAHGAHFGFHPYFPQNSNVQGADVVIHSIHKTLPALTQTALLHLNGGLIERKNVRHYLQIFQTSSPSYVLLAGIDQCIELLVEQRDEVFGAYVDLLLETRRELGQLSHLKLLETDHYDRSKLLLSVRDMKCTGRQLYEQLLSDSHLQLEMAAGSFVLAMTSVGDTPEGMARLVRALQKLDMEHGMFGNKEGNGSRNTEVLPRLKARYSSAAIAVLRKQAAGEKTLASCAKYVSWADSVGHISTEYAYIYPPGIPLIVPGEQISAEAVDILENYSNQGFSIEGIEYKDKIEVWING